MYAWLRRLLSDPPKSAAPASQSTEPAKPAAARHFAADDVSPMQRNQLDFLFSSWLFETEDYPDIFTNRNEDAILAALEEAVQSKQSGAHMVRRMPGVIPQLLQSLRSSDFNGAELARKISHDLVLVAEVLRMANSVAYSPGKPITAIEHAILVLGQNGLRQLITGVAFRPIINLNSGGFTKKLAPRLWAQSERCAVVSNLLARDKDVDQFEAFLAGLVLNVGLTVSLRMIDKLSDGRQPIGSPTFCNALASHGRALTINIGDEWHFPESVMTAIREQEALLPSTRLSKLGNVLAMGDYLSKMDILIRHGRLDRDDPAATDGLAEQEIACLDELAAMEDRDWIALATSAARGAMNN